MEAIKDCDYRVEIEASLLPAFWWVAYSKEETGLDEHLGMKGDVKTKKLAKQNWEEFAKINKIKKWKYRHCA